MRSVYQAALADLAGLPARSRWVANGAVQLHALDYGGDGVPLVVLPGITSPAITMDFVAGQIGDLVRPIILDVRGRGLSDSGGEYSLEEYAEDAEALIRGLGLDSPLLLGHSMGARIAATTAVRARVPLRGTVLIDPPMSGPGRGPYPTPLEVFLAQLDQAKRGTDADEVARSWPRWPRRELELRARWLSSCDEQAITLTHRGLETEDRGARAHDADLRRGQPRGQRGRGRRGGPGEPGGEPAEGPRGRAHGLLGQPVRLHPDASACPRHPGSATLTVASKTPHVPSPP
jgi:N-formylmaleamate deformylase